MARQETLSQGSLLVFVRQIQEVCYVSQRHAAFHTAFCGVRNSYSGTRQSGSYTIAVLLLLMLQRRVGTSDTCTATTRPRMITNNEYFISNFYPTPPPLSFLVLFLIQVLPATFLLLLSKNLQLLSMLRPIKRGNNGA